MPAAPIVVLIAGASGTGKSRLGYALARELGSALVEVDDLVVAAQALTDARTSPALHHWRLHDAGTMTTQEVVDGQLVVAHAMAPALRAVIDNHVETSMPVVVEGDYILPSGECGPAVRTVVVHEDDVAQLVANYREREPELGEQWQRATAGVAYGRWLVHQAQNHGVPVVSSRPFDTALARLRAALGSAP